MTDIMERLRRRASTRNTGKYVSASDTESMGYYSAHDSLLDEQAAAEIKRLKRFRFACDVINEEVCQTLGRALGYPWFADDPKNFPDATKDDGVCVGDHVAESLATEAASEIKRLRDLNAEMVKVLYPFAATAADYDGDPDDKKVDDLGVCDITVGHCRAALAILAKTGVDSAVQAVQEDVSPKVEGGDKVCTTCGGTGDVPAEVDTAEGPMPCPYVGAPCPDCNQNQGKN